MFQESFGVVSKVSKISVTSVLHPQFIFVAKQHLRYPYIIRTHVNRPTSYPRSAVLSGVAWSRVSFENAKLQMPAPNDAAKFAVCVSLLAGKKSISAGA
jgi:hypothetical protein